MTADLEAELLKLAEEWGCCAPSCPAHQKMAIEAARIGERIGLERAARIVDAMATYEDPGEFCYPSSPSDAIRAAKGDDGR